jgi:hypothetical protein
LEKSPGGNLISLNIPPRKEDGYYAYSLKRARNLPLISRHEIPTTFEGVRACPTATLYQYLAHPVCTLLYLSPSPPMNLKRWTVQNETI